MVLPPDHPQRVEAETTSALCVFSNATESMAVLLPPVFDDEGAPAGLVGRRGRGRCQVGVNGCNVRSWLLLGMWPQAKEEERREVRELVLSLKCCDRSS